MEPPRRLCQGPSHGGDDAEASDRRTFVISDCQDDMTRA